MIIDSSLMVFCLWNIIINHHLFILNQCFLNQFWSLWWSFLQSLTLFNLFHHFKMSRVLFIFPINNGLFLFMSLSSSTSSQSLIKSFINNQFNGFICLLLWCFWSLLNKVVWILQRGLTILNDCSLLIHCFIQLLWWLYLNDACWLNLIDWIWLRLLNLIHLIFNSWDIFHELIVFFDLLFLILYLISLINHDSFIDFVIRDIISYGRIDNWLTLIDWIVNQRLNLIHDNIWSL